MIRTYLILVVMFISLGLAATVDGALLRRVRPTATIQASPSSIPLGGASRLNWVGVNATSATLDTTLRYYTYDDPVRVPTSGFLDVSPVETTTYYLIVRNRRSDLNGNARADGWRRSGWTSVTVEVKLP